MYAKDTVFPVYRVLTGLSARVHTRLPAPLSSTSDDQSENHSSNPVRIEEATRIDQAKSIRIGYLHDR